MLLRAKGLSTLVDAADVHADAALLGGGLVPRHELPPLPWHQRLLQQLVGVRGLGAALQLARLNRWCGDAQVALLALEHALQVRRVLCDRASPACRGRGRLLFRLAVPRLCGYNLCGMMRVCTN